MLGLPASDEICRELQRRLHGLLAPLYGSPSHFPGGQPISFTRQHLSTIAQNDYYVCEKSDGERCLLWLGQPPGGLCGFLVDRAWRVRIVEGFGLVNREHSLDSLHNDTVLDGELIAERDEKGDSCKHRFLIFDILLLNGQQVYRLKLPERLGKIQNHVVEPFQFMLNNVPLYRPSMMLELKTMYKSYGIRELLDKVIPAQAHPNDGLIFTPVQEPYRSATWNTLLKWKPAELNTVDFVVGETCGGDTVRHELLIGKHGRLIMFGHSTDPELARYAGKVVECKLDPGGRNWLFWRERTDKLTPNDISVAEKILQSISDNVTKEDLYTALDEIYRNWKEREQGPRAAASAPAWPSRGAGAMAESPIPPTPAPDTQARPGPSSGRARLEWKSFEEYDDYRPTREDQGEASEDETKSMGKLTRQDDGEETSEPALDYNL